MASKKNKAATTSTTNQPTLKIGSRVRCTDDGVEGRIVWANGVSVKIEWTDGEKVTWKRDSLATRPIEILDADSDDDEATAPAATDAAEGMTAPTEAVQPTAVAAETTVTTEQPDVEPETTLTTAEQPQTEPETTPTTTEPTPTEPATSTTEPGGSEPVSLIPEQTAEPSAASTPAEAAPTSAKPKRQRKAAAEPKEKKVSALDAAAKVLAEAGKPMSTQEMIGVMAAKGFWSSPGGKTPSATLYSAILRELTTKGNNSRFRKVGRGHFVYHAQV